MVNRDLVRFKHMLDSAQTILTFVQGKQLADLDNDRLLASGVARELEILGEAASGVTKNIQDKFHNIPWKQMIGMRNRLIHAYFDIDYGIIWKTIEEKLPTLCEQLKDAIKSLEESQED